MSDLSSRIKEFLKRPPPATVDYAPGSVVEELLAMYATHGNLDDEELMFLAMCEAELSDVAADRTGGSADYFGECLDLVRAVQAELQ